MLTLDEIIGQDSAIAQLREALASRRMPHAYIFAGPVGVGRQTTAEALARALLCGRSGAEPARACGACDDCRMLAAGTHPDFHLVYKELAAYHEDIAVRSRKMQDLGIDVVRRFLIAPANQAPSRGRGRLFVVPEADLLSRAAQNALLKTLEEPPRGVTIVLICRQAEQLLPTTRSRCALIRFGLLPAAFVTERLTGEGIAADEARYWAALTGGSVGQSLQLARLGLYATKRDALERLAEGDPAGELGAYLAGLAEKLAKSLVAESKAEAGELAATVATRRATGQMLGLIAAAYRDAMRLAVGADAGELVNADQRSAIEALAGRFDAGRLAEIIEQLAEQERLLWRNVGAKLLWDNIAITCASGAPLEV